MLQTSDDQKLPDSVSIASIHQILDRLEFHPDLAEKRKELQESKLSNAMHSKEYGVAEALRAQPFEIMRHIISDITGEYDLLDARNIHVDYAYRGLAKEVYLPIKDMLEQLQQYEKDSKKDAANKISRLENLKALANNHSDSFRALFDITTKDIKNKLAELEKEVSRDNYITEKAYEAVKILIRDASAMEGKQEAYEKIKDQTLLDECIEKTKNLGPSLKENNTSDIIDILPKENDTTKRHPSEKPEKWADKIQKNGPKRKIRKNTLLELGSKNTISMLKDQRVRLGFFFTTTQGNLISNKEIIDNTGINGTALTSILSKESIIDPKITGGLSETTKVKLIDFLSFLGKPDKEIQAFQEVFDEMREIVGYQGKAKSRTESSALSNRW